MQYYYYTNNKKSGTENNNINYTELHNAIHRRYVGRVILIAIIKNIKQQNRTQNQIIGMNL